MCPGLRRAASARSLRAQLAAPLTAAGTPLAWGAIGSLPSRISADSHNGSVFWALARRSYGVGRASHTGSEEQKRGASVRKFVMGIVACAALLVISATPASAEGSPAQINKKVQKWVKARALEVAQDQGPVFPNAEVTKRGSSASCYARLNSRGNRTGVFRCFFSIYINEYEIGPSSVSDPPQRTFRICKNYSIEKPSLDAPLRIKRSAGGKLSIMGGWRQSCELDEFAFDLWAIFGPAYHPDVTVATPHAEAEVPVAELTEPRDDLLPAGANPGPAPGPLGTGQPARTDDKRARGPVRPMRRRPATSRAGSTSRMAGTPSTGACGTSRT